jgi:hypothetical protein
VFWDTEIYATGESFMSTEWNRFFSFPLNPIAATVMFQVWVLLPSFSVSIPGGCSLQAQHVDVFAVGIFRVYVTKYVIRQEMGNYLCLTCFLTTQSQVAYSTQQFLQRFFVSELQYIHKFDIYGSVHRRLFNRNTDKMQLCNGIYYSKVFEGSTCFERHTAHHQEL